MKQCQLPIIGTHPKGLRTIRFGVVLALVLFVLVTALAAESNSSKKDKTGPQAPALPGETYRPEVEVAAMEKTVTNLMQTVAQVAEAAKPPANTKRNLIVAVMAVLAGGLVLRFLLARNAKLAEAESNKRLPVFTPEEEQQVAAYVAGVTSRLSYSASEVPVSGGNPGERPIPFAYPKATEPAPAAPPSEEKVFDAFLEAARKDLSEVRELLSQISRTADDEAERQKLVGDVAKTITALKAKADSPTALPIWQMSSALEGLLNQVITKPANLTPSVMRTLANALDLLNGLCVQGLKANLTSEPPVRLLAVDDDAISRHAISLALKKVFDAPDLAKDGEEALTIAKKQCYDAIFLDVEMPGMDGFELCTKIHETTANGTTPVVFVTRHSDFNSRAKSTLRGGLELIGKPFTIFEVAVKALTLVMRQRLNQSANNQSVSSEVLPTGKPASESRAPLSLATAPAPA